MHCACEGDVAICYGFRRYHKAVQAVRLRICSWLLGMAKGVVGVVDATCVPLSEVREFGV